MVLFCDLLYYRYLSARFNKGEGEVKSHIYQSAVSLVLIGKDQQVPAPTLNLTAGTCETSQQKIRVITVKF